MQASKSTPGNALFLARLLLKLGCCFRFGDPGDAERSEATLSAPSAEVGEETLAAAIITATRSTGPLRRACTPPLVAQNLLRS